ncbi:MAG TPA: aspartate aminotransferase family protein [bacterium]|nr:aspartate aminotransferase family protein [bacterium]
MARTIDDILNPEKFSTDDVIALEKRYLAPCIGHYYKEPLFIARGKGALLYDNKGREYLDLFAGISTTLAGHCHPVEVDAIKRQLDRLMHASTLYPMLPMALFAEKLISICPPHLAKCFFTNSGSEANEAALHLMKKFTGAFNVLALNGSFHGRTLMAMSLTNQGTWRQNVPYAAGTMAVPPAYCYRCDFGQKYPGCGLECAHYVEKAIRCQTPNRIAGMIVEPIQGNGGVVDPPREYFKIVSETVKKYGGLLISDEVQTGFGRTGKMWGIENWDVAPDMMTMAKGIGSGYPIGAFVATDEAASCLKPKDLFSTFGGNPVASVAGFANIEILLKEKFAERALELGGYFKQGLLRLMDRHKFLGDVRGKGLMLGVEVVKDKRTKEPGTQETQTILNEAKDGGVLLGAGGLDNNVLRIKPPIVVSKAQIDQGLEAIDKAFSAAEGER